MKKKIIIWINLLIIIISISIITVSCKKKDNLVIAPITFNPSITYGSLTDQDGNIYKTVTIGTQIWMAENLKITKYRNGDPIQNVTDSAQWRSLTTGAYCYYENNTHYIHAYGLLYNWYTINDIRNLAPAGWHVATDTDWSTLNNFLGGEDAAGEKLAETGTTHWSSYNASTNESGFTALPGGLRGNQRIFGMITKTHYSDLGLYGFWWTSTESTSIYSWSNWISLVSHRSLFPKFYGFSVRCIKD